MSLHDMLLERRIFGFGGGNFWVFFEFLLGFEWQGERAASFSERESSDKLWETDSCGESADISIDQEEDFS